MHDENNSEGRVSGNAAKTDPTWLNCTAAASCSRLVVARSI
jgi:hypothetical protein